MVALDTDAYYLATGFTFSKRIFTSRSKDSNGAASYKRYVLYAALREMVSGFSVEQAQFFLPKTDTVYKWVAKLHNSKRKSIDLGNGANGHWIGRENAKYVILFLHGLHRSLMNYARSADVDRRRLLCTCYMGSLAVPVCYPKTHAQARY